MSKQPLTDLQRRTFFMALRPAAQEAGECPETYRKRILKEELGVEHMAEVGRSGDFDKLMSRIWQDRGDYCRALEYSTASIGRLRYMIVAAAKRIVEAKPDYAGDVYDYIAGVMHQSRMVADRPPRAWAARLADESAWLDFTVADLKRVLMMLNAHISRRAR